MHKGFQLGTNSVAMECFWPSWGHKLNQKRIPVYSSHTQTNSVKKSKQSCTYKIFRFILATLGKFIQNKSDQFKGDRAS